MCIDKDYEIIEVIPVLKFKDVEHLSGLNRVNISAKVNFKESCKYKIPKKYLLENDIDDSIVCFETGGMYMIVSSSPYNINNSHINEINRSYLSKLFNFRYHNNAADNGDSIVKFSDISNVDVNRCMYEISKLYESTYSKIYVNNTISKQLVEWCDIIRNINKQEVNQEKNEKQYISGMQTATFYSAETKEFSHRAIISPELLLNKFLKMCVKFKDDEWYYIDNIIDIDEEDFNRFSPLPHIEVYSTEDDIRELVFKLILEYSLRLEEQFSKNVSTKFDMIDKIVNISRVESKEEDCDYIYFSAYKLSKLISKYNNGVYVEYMVSDYKPIFKIEKKDNIFNIIHHSIFKVNDDLYISDEIIPSPIIIDGLIDNDMIQYTHEGYLFGSDSIIKISNVKSIKNDIDNLLKDVPSGIEYTSNNGQIIAQMGDHSYFVNDYDGDIINTLKFNIEKDKNIKNIKEDINMSNTGTNLTTINSNLYIGPYQNPNVTVSIYGLAIYNKTTEQWIAYNGQDTIDVSNFIITGMNMPIFALPVQIDKIKVGDIILHNGEVVVVNELKTGYKPTDNEDVIEEEPTTTSNKAKKKPTKKQYTKSVEVLNISKSEIRQVLPVKNPFGFDICTKLCVPFSMDSIGADMGEGMFNEKSLMAMAMFGGGMNMFGNMNGENNGQDGNMMTQMMQTSMMMKMMGGMNLF